MTVKELRDKLRDLPDDMLVIVPDNTGEYDDRILSSVDVEKDVIGPDEDGNDGSNELMVDVCSLS